MTPAAAALAAGVYAWAVAYVNSPEGQKLIKGIAQGLEWLGEQLRPDSESVPNVCEFGRRVSDKYGPLWKAPGMPGWKYPSAEPEGPDDKDFWKKPKDFDKWPWYKRWLWRLAKGAASLTGDVPR